MVATVLLGAGTARAAGPYVVGPGGAGATCSDAMPCTLATAAGLAVDGEIILLKPGTSAIAAGGVQLNDAETVMPQIPGTRPEVASTTGDGIVIFHPGARIQDIRIEVTGLAFASRALDYQVGGLVERVEVVAAAAAAGGIGVQLRQGAVLRDSTVWAQSSEGKAIVSGFGGGALRNVTALATGLTSVGLEGNGAFGVPQTTTVQNTILGGTTAVRSTNGAAANDVVVNIDHSNFGLFSHSPPNSVINFGAGNQNANVTPPMYAGIVAGNFHQVAGSPTIDAGLSNALGPLDFDGGARVVRATAVCDALPDIGADEFATALAAPAFCLPPVQANPPAPAKKCKKKKKKKKRSAGAAAKCKKKKKKRKGR